MKKSLVPGKTLAITLRDPGTGATLLAAGTVLTPRLIGLLHDMGMASEAALCLGTAWQRPAESPSGKGAPALSNPQRAARKRLHRSMASLRALLAMSAIGAGLLGWLTASPADVEAALAAGGLLAAAYAASFILALRTKAVLTAPVRKVVAFEPKAIEPRTEPQAA